MCLFELCFQNHKSTTIALESQLHRKRNYVRFGLVCILSVAVPWLMMLMMMMMMQDCDGNTPLHTAVRLGSTQLVDLLTDDAAGFNFRQPIDFHQVNARGFNVLHEAAFSNNC